MLLTPEQFASQAVGVPWQKWRADFDAMDCFGLIVLWHRRVLGVDLGDVPHTDIVTGFNAAGGWPECDLQAGATCFMAWRDGAPTHCGVMLTASEVLHAEGSEGHPGSVRVTRLSAIQKVYGPTRFYRYSQC